MDLPHYNNIFKKFQQHGFKVIYQPCVLFGRYENNRWNLQLPDVDTWTPSTLVVLHVQDFIGVVNGKCPVLEAIEQKYQDHSHRVVVIHWEFDLDKVYKGPLHLMYFPTHSYELIQKINAIKKQWIQNVYTERTVPYQCLNGTLRPHRVEIARYLKQHYPDGILSLDIEIPLPQWDYTSYKGCENELNWQRLQYVYKQCAVNIVTETIYDEFPGIISEKTLMAFLARQIPILVSSQGTVTQCENLGFDMFRDVVNLDYDTYQYSTRWQDALHDNSHLLTEILDLESYQERLDNNLERVLSMPEVWVEMFNKQLTSVIEAIG